LPEGLARNLTSAELDAVLAHELSISPGATISPPRCTCWWKPYSGFIRWCGGSAAAWSRNASAPAMRMCWLAANPPLVYAESILKVCRYYVQTPLACASGMSGPDLNVRLTAIMAGGVSDELSPTTSLLLATAGAAALMLPIAAGMLAQCRSRALPHGWKMH